MNMDVCPNCNESHWIQEVATAVITWTISFDAKGESASFNSIPDVDTDSEEHERYECRFCHEPLTDEYTEALDRLLGIY